MLSPSELGDRSESGADAFSIVEQRPDDRTVVIACGGELDLSTAPQLKWRLVDALEAGATAIVVDLGDVTFMDSTALGVLVGVRRSLEVGARLAIVCTHPGVLNIFQVSGLDGAFDMSATRDAALAHARGEEPRG
ncbi:MAG TPA: STAS domain-containing protein [Solirubrobacteraceae bacterium]|nr:STAS domain-containing protein [Solirubrobacteraceae bacterium]